MDFGDIESDPLKFCEDFKAFSEKNMDKYTSAQMKVQGISPILVCFIFWFFKFCHAIICTNFPTFETVAIESLVTISADFDRIFKIGRKKINAVHDKLLCQKKLLDDQAPDNQKLGYLSEFDRKVDGDIEKGAIVEEIREALGKVRLETPKAAEYEEAIENVTRYVHYDRLSFDDSGIQKALSELEKEINDLAEQSVEWSLKATAEPKKPAKKEPKLPSPRVAPEKTPSGNDFENSRERQYFQDFTLLEKEVELLAVAAVNDFQLIMQSRSVSDLTFFRIKFKKILPKTEKITPKRLR